MRLVQFELRNGERRVGVVEQDLVREVQDARTVRDLALAAIEARYTPDLVLFDMPPMLVSDDTMAFVGQVDAVAAGPQAHPVAGQPGKVRRGAGTLEEIFEIWTWGQLGFHAKPAGFLNVRGYYDGLRGFVDAAAGRGRVYGRRRRGKRLRSACAQRQNHQPR